MKILILDTYYPDFLKDFYGKNPLVKYYKYEKQKKMLMDFMFGTADFYSKELTKIGYPTKDVIVNNDYLQKSWQNEHKDFGSLNIFDKTFDMVRGRMHFLDGKIPPRWKLGVLRRQIEYYKPDVVFSHNLGYFDPAFLNSIKPKIKLLVGQIASPMPPKIFLKPYDLIITSFPHFVKKFKEMGIKSEYVPLCFDKSIIKRIPQQERKYNVTFVGGISRAHKKGLKLLYELAERVGLDVWGYGKEVLDPSSKLYKSHHGEAWGKDMYKIFLQSKITINRHIDVAENYANNMRLYEATGCGAMLITDKKKNLNNLFSVDKELEDYSSIDDLVEKINYYLTNGIERAKIAKAGQKRTLRDHNYHVRMLELAKVLEKYI